EAAHLRFFGELSRGNPFFISALSSESNARRVRALRHAGSIDLPSTRRKAPLGGSAPSRTADFGRVAGVRTRGAGLAPWLAVARAVRQGVAGRRRRLPGLDGYRAASAAPRSGCTTSTMVPCVRYSVRQMSS